jgi:hypothetical protein
LPAQLSDRVVRLQDSPDLARNCQPRPAFAGSKCQKQVVDSDAILVHYAGIRISSGEQQRSFARRSGVLQRCRSRVNSSERHDETSGEVSGFPTPCCSRVLVQNAESCRDGDIGSIPWTCRKASCWLAAAYAMNDAKLLQNCRWKLRVQCRCAIRDGVRADCALSSQTCASFAQETNGVLF